VPISSINSLDPGSLHSAANRFPEVLPLLLPATILVIPYTDLLLAVTRRVRAGKSPLAPDRKHLHHRLQDMGHPHRASVLILYLWAALFSAAIVWLSIARTPVFVFAVTTVVAIVALLFMSMPRLRWWQYGRRRRARAAALAAAKPAVAARPEPAAGNGSAHPVAGNGSARPAASNGTPRSGPAGPARPVTAPALPVPMLPAPTMPSSAMPASPLPAPTLPPPTLPPPTLPPATPPAGDDQQPGQAAAVGGTTAQRRG
jgi:UDP-GlcNAc:undecaprenyl-phosphate GlcNAc-1-phosphate transferase